MACSWPIEITNDGLASNLYISIVTEKWRKVVNLYKEHGISAITSKINTTGDTAFHLAVSMAPQHIVEKLLEIMKSLESGLRVTNNEGNTPLHVAASSGKLETSILLAKFDGFLGGVLNNRGESPLFSATYHGKKEIFLYLHHILHPETSRDIKDTSLYRRNDGDTILHSAISREYFDLAFEILRAVPSLAYAENERGITPLHILASKPSVFRSSCLIQLWDWRTIIYYCTWLFVGRLKHEPASQRFVNSVIEGFPESNNFQKYIKFFQGSLHECYDKCCDILSYLLDRISLISGYQFIMFIWCVLNDIWKIQGKHVQSVVIMKELIKCTENKNDRCTNFSDGGEPHRPIAKMEEMPTPIMLAASNGITPMVKQILKKFPTSINDKYKGDNIVLWAAKYKQAVVLRLLLKYEFVKCKLIHEVDMNENNALHLAAKLIHEVDMKNALHPAAKLIHEVDMNENNALHPAAKLGGDSSSKEPNSKSGAALQMQWEIKWYEFVKRSMPPHFCYQLNKDNQTPEEIFNDTHKELVQKGGEWLKKTSESCSVVAALIATVAFAASTAFPGELNPSNGMPNLTKRPGLSIFAIASLIALFFSITSLFSFLSIITDRCKQKDFHFKLPMRLVIALITLFIAIVSILVSFCAGHSFLLDYKLKNQTFNVYAGLTCLPILCFFLQQLPLYLDYVQANLSEVPPSSYKPSPL
ncbi:hypothetical protein ACB092_02G017500 [Castanea dentata]